MRVKQAILTAVVMAAVLAAGCDAFMSRKRDEARQRWAKSRAKMVTKLARRSYEDGEFARAREQLEPLVRSSTPYAPAYILAARLAADQGRLDEACDFALTATTTDPQSAEAWYVLGTVEQTLGREGSACEAFAKAADLAPENPCYVLADAEMLAGTGRPGRAAEKLADACERTPGSAEVHTAYGDVLSRLGRYQEACGQYRIALRLAPEKTGPTERLAIALFRSGAYEEAEPLLADLQESEPDFAAGWIRRMRADCLLALRRVDRARALYEQCARAAPEAAAPLVGLARCDVLQKRLPEARRHLETALAREPDHGEANGLLGYVLLASGRPGEAIPYLKLAVNQPACTGRSTIQRLLAQAKQEAAAPAAP